MVTKLKNLLWTVVMVICVFQTLVYLYGWGYSIFGPNKGRIESTRFIDAPGEVEYASGTQFNGPMHERPCHVPNIEVVPFKVLSANPPRILYSCNTFWLDNVVITFLEITGSGTREDFVDESSIVPVNYPLGKLAQETHS